MFLFIGISGILTAQEFEVPQQVKLEKPEDYSQYKQAVLSGITWLENTPVQNDKVKRESTSAFLLKYMSGTPDFTIAVMPFQMDLIEANPDLLLSFLGGWTRFALENPVQKDNALMANKAGIQSLMKVYVLNKGNGMKKDKKIERLLKMDEATLERWIIAKLGT